MRRELSLAVVLSRVGYVSFVMVVVASSLCHAQWNDYLYGMHEWESPQVPEILTHNGEARGWVLLMQSLDGYHGGLHGDVVAAGNAGFGVVVRLHWSYDPHGTLPSESQYGTFASRAANFIQTHINYCHYYVIGNETNLCSEWPRGGAGDGRCSADDFREKLSPQRYANLFQQVYNAVNSVAPNAKLCLSPAATWAGEHVFDVNGFDTYDFICYTDTLYNLIPHHMIGGLAFHPKTHRHDPGEITNMGWHSAPHCGETCFGCNQDVRVRWYFPVYQTELERIPQTLRNRPIFFKELNPHEPHYGGWQNIDNGYIVAAYNEVARWNSTSPDRKVAAMMVYRWPMADFWGIREKPNVHQDLRNAVARGQRNPGESWYGAPIATPTPDAPPTATPTPGTPYQESGGLVVVEGERLHAVRPGSGYNWNFYSAFRPGWAGDGYMRAEPADGHTFATDYELTSPRMDYTVSFSTPGTYYVWVRMQRSSTTDNKLHFGLNWSGPDSARGIINNDTINEWVWVNQRQAGGAATLSIPSAGLHTINIWMYDDGARVDRWLMTTDAGYTPTGTGPAESGRTGSYPPPSPTPVGVIIIDNQDPGFTKQGFPTSAYVDATAGASYNNHFYFCGNEETVVDWWGRWTPSGLAPGTYTVRVNIPSRNANTCGAKYEIVHNGQTQIVTICQDNFIHNDWPTLGSFYFSGSGNEYIHLGDATGEGQFSTKIAWDAVMLIPTDPQNTPVPSATPLPPTATPTMVPTQVGCELVSQGRPVTASSYYQNNPMYAPSKAVDGVIGYDDSRWITDADATGQGHWLVVDLGAQYDLCQAKVYGDEAFVYDQGTGDKLWNMSGYFVRASNQNTGDPRTWTQLARYEEPCGPPYPDYPGEGVDAHNTHALQGSYRYVCLHIDRGDGECGAHARVQEFQVFGSPSQQTTPVPTATPTPGEFCYGDANHDGFVNGDDFRAVRDYFGVYECGTIGDANGDCFVNGDDFRAVRDHFGQSCN